MKEELDKGNRSIFSLKLQKEIRCAIEENNQVILFLNRRGYANFVSCRKCGYVFQCENCDISLTYHKKSNTGRCHYCGYEKEIPKSVLNVKVLMLSHLELELKNRGGIKIYFSRYKNFENG